MSTSGFGVRSEGVPISPPLPTPAMSSTTQPRTDLLDPMAVAMEHMIVMMGRVETSLNMVVKAVTPQGPPLRPDAAPPYGRSEYFQGNPTPLSGAPSTAWLPPPPASQPLGFSQQLGLSQPPGFAASQLQRRPWEPTPPKPLISSPSTQPTLPDIFVPHQTPAQFGQLSCWDLPNPQPQQPTIQQPMAQPVQPSCWSNPALRQNPGSSSTDPSRLIKMKPPRFNGTDAPSWISRVQFYFDHLMLPVDQRLHYVVMLFDPPAADWIFNYQANNNCVLWPDFLEDVRRRFDPLCFQNFIGLIAKLTQTGSLADYNDKFESMLNRVRGVSESTLVPIYVEGLQQPVKNQVKHQYPSSVASAMALAVEYDGCTERPTPSPGFQRRQWVPR